MPSISYFVSQGDFYHLIERHARQRGFLRRSLMQPALGFFLLDFAEVTAVKQQM